MARPWLGIVMNDSTMFLNPRKRCSMDTELIKCSTNLQHPTVAKISGRAWFYLGEGDVTRFR